MKTKSPICKKVMNKIDEEFVLSDIDKNVVAKYKKFYRCQKCIIISTLKEDRLEEV